MNTNRINTVASEVDDNSILQFLVMIFTANQNRKFDFYLKIAYTSNLLSQTNYEIIHTILDYLEISHEFIRVELEENLILPQFLDANKSPQNATFFRLHLADTLADIFLWLSFDVICLKGWDDIFENYRTDIESASVCAAVDLSPLGDPMTRRYFTKNSARIRIGHENYFNTGVMLINPNHWRSINKGESWKDMIKKFNELGFQQVDCVTNYLCFNSYRHIDSGFNKFTSKHPNHKINGQTKILHFAGPNKPWFYRITDISVFFWMQDIDLDIKPKYFYAYMRNLRKFLRFVNTVDVGFPKILEVIQANLQKKQNYRHLWHHKIYKLKRRIKRHYYKNSIFFQRKFLLFIWYWKFQRHKIFIKQKDSSKIVAITVSTNYSEILQYIIEKNRNLFGAWIIVTDPNDLDTIEVVKQYPDLELLFFDFKRDGRKFNKGGAVRMAQHHAYRKYPEDWYLILDSDISIRLSTGLTKLNELDKDLIYACDDRRDYSCLSDLAKQKGYSLYRETLTSGFFQLYWQKKFYRDSPTAGYCDTWFVETFFEIRELPDVSCDHLGAAGNWDGNRGTGFRFDR